MTAFGACVGWNQYLAQKRAPVAPKIGAKNPFFGSKWQKFFVLAVLHKKHAYFLCCPRPAQKIL